MRPSFFFFPLSSAQLRARAGERTAFMGARYLTSVKPLHVCSCPLEHKKKSSVLSRSMSWARIIYSCIEASNLRFFISFQWFSSPVMCSCMSRMQKLKRKIFKRNKSPEALWVFRRSLWRTKIKSDFSEGSYLLHFPLSAARFIHSVWKNLRLTFS